MRRIKRPIRAEINMNRRGLYSQALALLTPLRCLLFVASFLGAQIIVAAHSHEHGHDDDHHHHDIPEHHTSDCAVCLIGDRLDDDAYAPLQAAAPFKPSIGAVSSCPVIRLLSHCSIGLLPRAPPTL